MNKQYLKNTIALLFLVSSISIMNAQPLREVPYEMLLEAADEAYQTGDFYNAGEFYEKAYKEQRDKDIALKVAEINMILRDYKRAVSWYKRIVERDKTGFYKQYKLELGKALKYQGEYNEAYGILSEFISESEDGEKNKEAALLMNGIAKSGEFEENVDVIIKTMGKSVNSPSSEAGARNYGDVVYYTSLNRKNEIVYNSKLEGETHFKIYTTSLDDKGKYKKGSPLGEEINREGYHTGNPTFSEDGMTMYFTRTLIEDGEELESKVYYAKKKGNNWGASYAIEGDLSDDKYKIKYPVLGELYGKKVLFFAGEIEGGFGGLDIYYSESTGPYSFGTPINLGETINTKYDEVTPFYREGVLYFSSEGYPGYGGMDIFQTTWDGTSWSEITNMGAGYNSTVDDIYYAMDAEGKQGFLVSNRVVERKRSVRSKTCCDDLYSVSFREVVIDLLAKVTDGENPLNEAEMTVIDLSVGEEKNGPVKKTNLNGNEFNFGLEQDKPYKVVVRREGYYPDSIEFNTVGILDDFTVERTIALREIPPPPPEDEYETITTNQPIRMNNIYYELDSDKILPAAEGDLSQIFDLMNKYPDMVIELSSHTDSQGTSSYNKRLSQRRAESAKNWLLARGVDANRIQAVGYGEDVILNRCVNGVRCSDDEHQFNRRTEFKIISGPTTIEIKKRQKVVRPSGGLPMNFGIDLYDQEVTTLQFKENNLDLGTIKLGEMAEMEFEYKNTGTIPLVIEVVTACHCTSFDYDKEPLAPGKSAKIKASFNSLAKKKTGELREVINIICNTDNLVEEAIFTVKVEE